MLTVESTSIEVEPNDTVAVITITSNVDWTAESDSEDISISANSGSGNGSITVTLPANETFSARTYNVTVESEKTDPVVVTIKHKAVVPSIAATSVAAQKFSDYSVTFDVTSNIPWKIECAGNLTVDVDAFEGDTTVTVSFGINLDAQAVEHSLTISSDSTGLDVAPVQVKFSQEAFTGKLAQDSLSFAKAIGGSKNVDVSENPYVSDNGCFSVQFARGTNSNLPKYYYNGTHCRVYGGNVTTIASKNGKKFVKIEFATTEGYEFAKSSSANPDSGYVSGNNEWMGYAETVVLSKHPSQGTQFRLQKVVVTYVE